MIQIIPLYEAVNKSLDFYMSVALNRFKGIKHKHVYFCKDNGRYYYRYPKKCSDLLKIKTESVVNFVSKKEIVTIMKWIVDNKISILIEIYDPIARQYVFDCGLINIFQDYIVIALWRTCSNEVLRELEKFRLAPFKVIFIIGLEEYLNALLGKSLQSSKVSEHH